MEYAVWNVRNVDKNVIIFQDASVEKENYLPMDKKDKKVWLDYE